MKESILELGERRGKNSMEASKEEESRVCPICERRVDPAVLEHHCPPDYREEGEDKPVRSSRTLTIRAALESSAILTAKPLF